jgi:hypothetical protein
MVREDLVQCAVYGTTSGAVHLAIIVPNDFYQGLPPGEQCRRHPVGVPYRTVSNKLVKKGLLRRGKQQRMLHYEACWSEEEFRAIAARRVVDGILSFGPTAIAASFVDALAEQDPDQLRELERLVRERLHGPVKPCGTSGRSLLLT